MNATSSPISTFRWRWILAAVVANVVGLFVVPAYDWTSRPVETWLSLVVFPFGMLSGLAPSLKTPALFYWFAPLPVYGFLLAIFAHGPHRRIWYYSIAALHTVAAGIAAVKYFRL